MVLLLYKVVLTSGTVNKILIQKRLLGNRPKMCKIVLTFKSVDEF